MPVSYSGTAITWPDSSTTTSGWTGFKNRIINGAMVIDQRNAGASVTQTTSVAYTLDRWACYGAVSSKFTVQQNAGSVTPPTGFVNYLGVTSSSAYSVGTTDLFMVRQPIEGLNIADLGWGTANAATVTLSFWVRSSLTGTFGGSLTNGDVNRSYPFSYTISSANTWTQISVTIAGPTSGTWYTNNGVGIRVYFNMGAGSSFNGTAGSWATVSDVTFPTGSTSVVGTNGATWYITGVQLERGSTASSFDYRPYGTELALCQRYYYRAAGMSGNYMYLGTARNYSTTACQIMIPLPVPMRSAPSVTSTGSIMSTITGATGTAFTITTDGSSTTTAGCLLSFSSGTVTNDGLTFLRMNNTTDTPQFIAEL